MVLSNCYFGIVYGSTITALETYKIHEAVSLFLKASGYVRIIIYVYIMIM